MKRVFSSLVLLVMMVLNVATVSAQETKGFHQVLKERFIEGGAGFMGIVLLCLILGLAVAIERIIFLNMATTNTKKLTKEVEDALASGGVEAAKEVCRNTKGPVASIFYKDWTEPVKVLILRESCSCLWWSSNGTVGEKRILGIIVYRYCANAWVHGYGNRYDSGLR